jgi:hypothetical protein
MADERRRCHCRDDEKVARGERREEECTDATLAVALVDAEHRYVSPEVTFAMGRLLADYYPDGMGFTLSICLWEELSGTIASRKKWEYDSYKEGEVRPTVVKGRGQY